MSTHHFFYWDTGNLRQVESFFSQVLSFNDNMPYNELDCGKYTTNNENNVMKSENTNQISATATQK